MRLLLDTHVLLWALQDSRSLGREARERLHLAQAVFVSAASIWEAQLKAELGKLTLPAGFVAAVGHSGFGELAVSFEHVADIGGIKLPHKDPFDRLLLAQAMQEQCALMTADEVLLSVYPAVCIDGRR